MSTRTLFITASLLTATLVDGACMGWCTTNPTPWIQKCNWEQFCAGCPECPTETPTESPTRSPAPTASPTKSPTASPTGSPTSEPICKSWCAGNTQPWIAEEPWMNQKCNWQLSCSGCPECHVATDSPTTSPTAPAEDIDVSYSICPGLVGWEKTAIPDMASCEALCQLDEGCDVWQYCPAPHSCKLHGEENGWSPGDWMRCYTSTTGSDRGRCDPDPSDLWIGMARSLDGFTLSDRVPSRTVPTMRKRGFSGFLDGVADDNQPGFTCEDAKVLGLFDAWYYKWTVKTSYGDGCRHGTAPLAYPRGMWGVDQAFEFVPMIIGVNQAANVLSKIDTIETDWTRANAHFLLGYNEPDPSPNHPHSALPADAAQDWVDVQQIAAAFDPPLILISPAPASENFDDDGKSEWLDEFFGNCTHVVADCDPSLIRHVAFHDYRGNVTQLIRRIEGMYQRYGNRTLWLTEFAIGRWSPSPTRDEEESYMQDVLPVLEANPYVMRYNWFSARVEPSQWGGVKNLLPWDNTTSIVPTSTGEIYAGWPDGSS